MTGLDLPTLRDMVIWGLVATVAMTTVMQGLGLSHLSLPFLAGTFFTSDRRRAMKCGFIFYVVRGWLLAFLYCGLFTSLRLTNWWFGALVGLLHGLFLLVCGLPLLPYVHPRMSSEYDSVSALRQLESPGFMELNYGHRTPLTTFLRQVLYGAVLGRLPQLQSWIR